MSRTFSTNSGSLESFQCSTRCGCRPNARQTRETVDCERPLAAAIRRVDQCAPPDGGTHWSTRRMAAASGLSQSTVSRVWRAFGLQPYRVAHGKLSKDPLFVEKVRDIVGLYLDPPERVVVLCVDEKSQIQALDRRQPLLLGRPARAAPRL